MAIRLVAVDVDGTLVTADQRVLPRVQAAAQRALEHGIQLVLCTGRAPGECWYILDALPQIRYAVTQTGAIAQDLKTDRKSTRLNSSHPSSSRIPSSA